MQLPFLNDPFAEGIAKRVRTVVARHPGHCLDDVANALSLPPASLQRFMTGQERVLDTMFLIDVVAVLVHECGIDPKWLLTGEYDSEAHRHALTIGEDRTPRGFRLVRELVQQEYRRLRHAKHFSWLPTMLRDSIRK